MSDKIGFPGVHYGKVFRMLYIGYSPQHGQRFHVPVSQLYVSATLTETTHFGNPILAPVTRRREFKSGGVFEVMAMALNEPPTEHRPE